MTPPPVSETFSQDRFFLWWLPLGKPVRTKTDEFLEKFQTAFDPPPPSFSENHVADFLNSCTALKTIHVVYF